MPGRCQVYLTEPLLARWAILASSSSAICTEAHTPCDWHRLICREQSCSQDMRDNTRWRFGRGTVEGYGDTQRTDQHRGRENERYHGDPSARSIIVRNRLGELAPALTDRRIDGGDQALHARLVT